MTEYWDSVCLEMGNVVKRILAKEDSLGCTGSYAAFIRYCLEQLNKGGSVQEVWHDYLVSTK